jgi:hypothetical protein
MTSLILSRECLDALHAVVMRHCPCSLEDREFLPTLVAAVEDEIVRLIRPTRTPANRSHTMNPTNDGGKGKTPTLDEIIDRRLPSLCARLAEQLDDETRTELCELIHVLNWNSDEESAVGQALNALWNELSEGLL